MHWVPENVFSGFFLERCNRRWLLTGDCVLSALGSQWFRCPFMPCACLNDGLQTVSFCQMSTKASYDFHDWRCEVDGGIVFEVRPSEMMSLPQISTKWPAPEVAELDLVEKMLARTHRVQNPRGCISQHVQPGVC